MFQPFQGSEKAVVVVWLRRSPTEAWQIHALPITNLYYSEMHLGSDGCLEVFSTTMRRYI